MKTNEEQVRQTDNQSNYWVVLLVGIYRVEIRAPHAAVWRQAG